MRSQSTLSSRILVAWRLVDRLICAVWRVARVCIGRWRTGLLGAELHHLGVLLDKGQVSGCHIVGVTRLEGFLPVGVADPYPALEDVAPVGALAPVVRQPFEVGRRISSAGKRLDRHVHLGPFGLSADEALPVGGYLQIFFRSTHGSAPPTRREPGRLFAGQPCRARQPTTGLVARPLAVFAICAGLISFYHRGLLMLAVDPLPGCADTRSRTCHACRTSGRRMGDELCSPSE